ncbi:MAG: hypothetical protein KBA18_06560 [Kiritimatiellae bacterium]|nr:hypothetical protein [Kiritimatiellia bacterium]HQL51430.1 hypothetical protein [Kiritimatiellia bacterium]
MKRFGQSTDQGSVANVISRVAFAALLALTLLQQTGGRLCDGAALGAFTAGAPSDSEPSWSGRGCDVAGAVWSGTEDGLACDALLPARRVKLVIASDSFRFHRSPDGVRTRFHGNTRPPILRTKAVFCEFSSLRSILHPHFSWIAHASSVLC